MLSRALVGWATLAVVLVLCVTVAVGAYLLADYSWNAVVDYSTPYVELAVPPSRAGSQMTSTTVLVIVDGLNDKTSRRLEGLQRLRQYGTDLTLLAQQPSLSYPNWTTLLSGAPPYVSGVTTNWFEGKVPPETLIDSAVRSGVDVVVVGPKDLEELYGASRATASFLRSYPSTHYASTELVDAAVALIGQAKPRLAVVLLPDIDNAGHRSGGDSEDYLETARKVDIDISRLVQNLQDQGTTFVIAADHGHVPAGGHGGWETDVVEVPGVFFGQGVLLGEGNAKQEDVAPTIAVLAGIPVPRFSKGDVLDGVVGEAGTERLGPAWSQRLRFADAYVRYVLEPTGQTLSTEFAEYAHGATVTRAMDDADAIRLDHDRRIRLWPALAGVAIALIVLVAIGLASWRALVAGLVGAVAYYVVYDGLYFLVHGYRWSLSAFNEEAKLRAFFNARMAEALVAGLVAAVVAGVVYPLLRGRAQGPWGIYRPRWLTLGPVAVLVVLATLGIQVAWFVWAWGVAPEWNLPDLMWGLKYDLDLIQATALGVAAVLSPLVTYVVGRYHPKTRGATLESAVPGEASRETSLDAPPDAPEPDALPSVPPAEE